MNIKDIYKRLIFEDKKNISQGIKEGQRSQNEMKKRIIEIMSKLTEYKNNGITIKQNLQTKTGTGNLRLEIHHFKKGYSIIPVFYMKDKEPKQLRQQGRLLHVLFTKDEDLNDDKVKEVLKARQEDAINALNNPAEVIEQKPAQQGASESTTPKVQAAPDVNISRAALKKSYEDLNDFQKKVFNAVVQPQKKEFLFGSEEAKPAAAEAEGGEQPSTKKQKPATEGEGQEQSNPKAKPNTSENPESGKQAKKATEGGAAQ